MHLIMVQSLWAWQSWPLRFTVAAFSDAVLGCRSGQIYATKPSLWRRLSTGCGWVAFGSPPLNPPGRRPNQNYTHESFHCGFFTLAHLREQERFGFIDETRRQALQIQFLTSGV